MAYPWVEAPRHAKKGGLYCNPFIGVRFMTTKKQAVNLGIGYSIQKVSFDEEWGDGSGDMNGFSIKVGYEF